MVVSLILTEILMHKYKGAYYAYGESARCLMNLIGWRHACHDDSEYLGASYVIPKCSFDIVAPKVVKAGYKIRIEDNGRKR